MQKVKKAIDTLDGIIVELHDEYIGLHKELDNHRGKKLDDTNLAEVNRILKEIQDKFAQLYPALYFIASRYQFASNVTNSYEQFIESIKKAGAQADGPSKIIQPGSTGKVN